MFTRELKDTVPIDRMQRETDRAVPQLLPSSSATTIHRGSMGNPNEIHRNGPPLFGKGADVGLSESRYDVRGE